MPTRNVVPSSVRVISSAIFRPLQGELFRGFPKGRGKKSCPGIHGVEYVTHHTINTRFEHAVWALPMPAVLFCNDLCRG